MSGSYNGEYHDFDVYVHSNQPDDKATVTDAGGASASYYTDSSGYADVYLSAPANASGERVTRHESAPPVAAAGSSRARLPAGERCLTTSDPVFGVGRVYPGQAIGSSRALACRRRPLRPRSERNG